ncbi:MAG: ABC transporter ATP-binding protein [Caldilineaceae bacterium]|nr:ABC transporter ATP-binding protein [Caldilineaceae bacterium]
MDGKLAIYRRLLGYLKPHWRQVLLAYISMIVAALLNLYIPQVIKNAIDQGVNAQEARGLFTAAGVILVIAVVRGVAAFGQRYYGNWLTHRVAYDLRNHFYARIQSLPFAFHDQAKTGDLMSRATSDISETERFTGIGMMDLVSTIVLLVGVLVAMFLENVQLTLLVVGPMLFLVGATLRFGYVVRDIFKAIQKQMGVLSATMQESMTGINVVKAFAREPFELDKFDGENEVWFEQRRESIRMWANYWPLFTFLLAAAVFLLLWFGGPMALDGRVTVGTIFALISYVLMLNGPTLRLGFLVNMAATASASAARVFEVIDTPNVIQEKPDAKELPRMQGDVRFENVSFAYANGRRVLRDISFHVEPDQVVALIGPTGSGKSSVINLIPRFYDPTRGVVRVDGMNVKDLRVKKLRRNIGIVLQNPFLFNATIAENIAYGRPDASQEEIEAAARAAQAHEFIMSFPDGYETQVGERGVTLSGGQKQRVAIGRALLLDPRILILDDSTSAVDTETEHLIQMALQELMQGRTTFVIAQRLLTLKNADMILVLDDGHIVERGTHAELVHNGGLYQQIYDLQLKDQEELGQAAREMALA